MEKEEGALLEENGLRGEAERPLGEATGRVLEVVGEVKLLLSWLAIGEAVAILLLW